MTRTALITGVTGQTGRYLAELLLDLDYEVHGLVRRVSYPPPFEPDPRLRLHTADLTDAGSLEQAVIAAAPDEIYNLAAMSDVHASFGIPVYTGDVAGLGAARLLDTARRHAPEVRIYQAGTSEMFGASPPPQNEDTPFAPRSPYAVAKLYAHQMAVLHRDAYGMFVCNGILFNHESPRRGRAFVTRKITRGLARISGGRDDCLYLGNLNAERDWGHARDYARAQWLMLQHHEPDDFVVASGVMRTVREFAGAAALRLGMTLQWLGEGMEETAVDRRTGRTVIRVDPSIFRPIEVERLQGDSGKARRVLGWRPEVTFDELVDEMVENDVRELRRE